MPGALRGGRARRRSCELAWLRLASEHSVSERRFWHRADEEEQQVEVGGEPPVERGEQRRRRDDAEGDEIAVAYRLPPRRHLAVREVHQVEQGVAPHQELRGEDEAEVDAVDERRVVETPVLPHQ